MKRIKQNTLERRANILKALAHPSRLMMVDELAKGERCVCELQQLVRADMSTVSKHLTVLKRAGLVESEKRGLQVFYTLLSPCVMNFFTCVESVIAAHKEQAATVARK
ncbi:MAG: ArsR family transcriptional regulator [Lentisphaerales bacterium]|jgi:ArsR family transcriptional regulator|nr:MAG: ArsR family transcriptional regulator [Lentisphaerales bacterium]